MVLLRHRVFYPFLYREKTGYKNLKHNVIFIALLTLNYIRNV